MLVFSLLLLNCQPTSRKSVFEESREPSHVFRLDSGRFYVLDYDSSYDWTFPKSSINATLTTEDLIISEQLLDDKIKTFDVEGQIKRDSLDKKYPNYQFYEKQFSINLNDYRK